MAKFLYGTSLTANQIAANNRGATEGNVSTLQKINYNGEIYTTISAEAYRFSIRYGWQLKGLPTNRIYDIEKNCTILQDPDFIKSRKFIKSREGIIYIDDDLFGFMNAKAAKICAPKNNEDTDSKEQEVESIGVAPKKKITPKEKDSKKSETEVATRTSPVMVATSRALRTYKFEVSFNCQSGEKEKGGLSLYATEKHHTEYQTSFGLNLEHVVNKDNILNFLDSTAEPSPVGGNHARFMYDFSPELIIYRVTDSCNPRIANCVELDEKSNTFSLNLLLERVECGDILPEELVIGGVNKKRFAEIEKLKSKGVVICDGVNAAKNIVAEMLRDDCKTK